MHVRAERQPSIAVQGVQPLPFEKNPAGHGVLVAVGVTVGVSVAVGVAVGIGTQAWPFDDSMYPAWQAVHCELVAPVQVSAEVQKGTSVHAGHVNPSDDR